MRLLVIGDNFIPAEVYVRVLAASPVADAVSVRSVDWAGDKAAQHKAQQRMEWNGPDAVPAPTEIVQAVGDAEVLAAHFAPVPSAVLQAGRDLKAVVLARSGTENVDVDAASRLGIAVVRVSGRNASAVAELALGLMLNECRSIARADRSIKNGDWRKSFPRQGTEVGGSTVGFVGFGHVGHELAWRLHGFGCRLLVADPYADEEALHRHHAERTDLDTVFRESDFVQVTARLTAETERFINARHFSLMKPSAYFVNTSRSRLVNTEDLYDALAAGRIAGAALDVYDQEPLPADSPWRTLDNVTLTPHYGGDTLTTNATSARLVAEAVAELHASGRCRGAVNAHALGWT
ncbi:2-hydroxyacid dehydrogenase [Streptomyces sp. NPDC054841]